jgi:uncharacterized membrane protein YtjA (UPF0391 family)
LLDEFGPIAQTSMVVIFDIEAPIPLDGIANASVEFSGKKSLNPWRGTIMLRAAFFFIVLALIAGVLGLARTEYLAANIAWILFVVFLVLALLSFVFGPRSGPPPV